VSSYNKSLIRRKRNFLKLFGLSYLAALLLPYNLLYSITKKIINPNLSKEQKKIMLDESTERPYSSPLNNEKRINELESGSESNMVIEDKKPPHY